MIPMVCTAAIRDLPLSTKFRAGGHVVAADCGDLPLLAAGARPIKFHFLIYFWILTLVKTIPKGNPSPLENPLGRRAAPLAPC